MYQQNAHQNLAINVLAINGILQNDVSNTTPGVENIGVVSRVLEVFSKSDFVLLNKFIHGWVNNSTDKHHREDSLLTQSVVNVDFIYINHHGNHIYHMSNETDKMCFISMGVPLKLNKILNTIALEDIEFVSFDKAFKKVQTFIFHSLSFEVTNTVFSDYWQQVD